MVTCMPRRLFKRLEQNEAEKQSLAAAKKTLCLRFCHSPVALLSDGDGGGGGGGGASVRRGGGRRRRRRARLATTQTLSRRSDKHTPTAAGSTAVCIGWGASR